MNERYLFRGKRISNGEWIQGYYFRNLEGRCFIRIYDTYEVDPATVGQCTGLRDRKGALIFEGDIVKYPPHDKDCTVTVCWSYDNACFRQQVVRGQAYTPGTFLLFRDDGHMGVVIGSIYDNPELLEAAQ